MSSYKCCIIYLVGNCVLWSKLQFNCEIYEQAPCGIKLFNELNLSHKCLLVYLVFYLYGQKITAFVLSFTSHHNMQSLLFWVLIFEPVICCTLVNSCKSKEIFGSRMASEIWKYSIWVERAGFSNYFVLPDEQMQWKQTALSAAFLLGRLNEWIIY